jgi:ATP-binding cassette subfamily B protein
VFNLVTPYLLGQAVDQAHHLFTQAPAAAIDRALLLSALLIVAACALRGALTGLQGYLGESIAQHVGRDLRLAFFAQLQHLGFAYHDSHHSGDLIARGMLDLEGVRAFLESGLLRAVTLGLLVGAGSWRLLGADFELGVLALGFVPFVIWRATRMGLLLRVSWQRLQAMMSDLTLGMEENLQGMRVVRAFAARGFELARFDRVADAALRLSNRRITVRMGSMSAMNLAYYVSMGLVLLVGGRRVAAGVITVGTLTEILTFITVLQQPLRQVGMIVNASARATGAGARLFEVLDAVPPITDRPGARGLAAAPGVLRFEAVGFRHAGAAEGALALRDISFELRRGRTLGIVGPPGSGKSTLAQLLPRLYDVGDGRITLDGQDVRDLTLSSLRAAVAMVPQDGFMFDASIRDNIAYAVPGLDLRQVRRAAALAQIDGYVADLPEGYDSRTGERGVALSGGQRQRLAIARALAARPAFIVLDDATSAVDTRTERDILAGLRAALTDVGVILIAHRLAALADADEILVLDGGRIIERGTHAQLLARAGFYARLWALQGHAAAAALRQTA